MEIASVVGVLATLVATAVAIHGATATSGGPGPGPSSTTASPTAPATSHPPTASGPGPGSSSLPPGSCLPSSLTHTIACDADHSYEVVTTSACNEAALVQYLGGRPDIDIVTAQPQLVDTKISGRACVVHDPTLDVARTSSRGVLGSASSSGWRLCRDERIARDVSCADEHTGEYVLLSSPTAVDCEQAASRYLNAPSLRFKGRLQVETVQRPAGPQCLVVVQGADLLTATVRNIGVSALPTVSS